MALSKKKKKQSHRPRHHRMTRQGRLRSARDSGWLSSFSGKRIVQAYKKRFGVDLLCAIAELRLLGVNISQEYEEQVRRSIQKARKARKDKKTPLGTSDVLDEFPESDEWFAYIAGYTSGGLPYGVTWEEWEEMEDNPPGSSGVDSEE